MSAGERLALQYCVKYLHRLPCEIDLPARALVDLAVVALIEGETGAGGI